MVITVNHPNTPNVSTEKPMPNMFLFLKDEIAANTPSNVVSAKIIIRPTRRNLL